MNSSGLMQAVCKAQVQRVYFMGLYIFLFNAVFSQGDN